MLDTFRHVTHEHPPLQSFLLCHPLPLVALEHVLLARVKPVTNLRSGHFPLLHFADPFDKLGPLFLRALVAGPARS